MNPIWNLPVVGASGRPDQVWLFDDFVTYSGSATADASAWFEQLAGTAAGAVASSDTVAGGIVTISCGTVSVESGIEPNGVGFSVPGIGKRLYFETRCNVKDVTLANGTIFVGLATASDVTPAAGATNRIGFKKLTASAVIQTVIDATETASTKSLTSLADAVLSFLVVGGDKIYYFVDLLDGNGPAKVATTTALPAAGTVLMPKFYVGFAANAGDQELTLDYVLVVQER